MQFVFSAVAAKSAFVGANKNVAGVRSKIAIATLAIGAYF
jgi:hypothetical protein